MGFLLCAMGYSAHRVGFSWFMVVFSAHKVRFSWLVVRFADKEVDFSARKVDFFLKRHIFIYVRARNFRFYLLTLPRKMALQQWLTGYRATAVNKRRSKINYSINK